MSECSCVTEFIKRAGGRCEALPLKNATVLWMLTHNDTT